MGRRGLSTWFRFPIRDLNKASSDWTQRAVKSRGGPVHTPQETARRRVAWRRSLSASEMALHQQGEAYKSRATRVARQTVERERMGRPEDLRTLRVWRDWDA